MMSKNNIYQLKYLLGFVVLLIALTITYLVIEREHKIVYGDKSLSSVMAVLSNEPYTDDSSLNKYSRELISIVKGEGISSPKTIEGTFYLLSKASFKDKDDVISFFKLHKINDKLLEHLYLAITFEDNGAYSQAIKEYEYLLDTNIGNLVETKIKILRGKDEI